MLFKMSGVHKALFIYLITVFISEFPYQPFHLIEVIYTRTHTWFSKELP